MGMVSFASFLIAVVGTGSTCREVNEHVDLVELNHFHDCLGRHVYDQVIFYEWAPDTSQYYVRAWCLIEDRDIVNRRPMKRYSDNLYEVQWQDRDQNLLRIITSTHYRESWTQVDPERANKKVLDERLRTVLIRRSVVKQDKVVEAEDPSGNDGEQSFNEIANAQVPSDTVVTR